LLSPSITRNGLILYREVRGDEKTEREKKTDISVHITTCLNVERKKKTCVCTIGISYM
jgi:hypothetical protein